MPVSSPESRPVFSVRAIVTGSALTLCIALGAPYGNMVLRGSTMALDFSTPGAIFLFFALVGLLNPLAARLRPGWALGRRELLVVYVMMIVGSSICTMGLSEYLLPIITSFHYYATPANDWASLIQPHVPAWLAPQDPQAIKWFYEGAPRQRGVPWGAWALPLASWAVFIAALYLVMIATMVLAHCQWAENERLIYPLVQVPLEMVREDGDGGRVRPFFRSPVMWAGFAIPAIVSSIRGLHAYYAFIPDAPLVSYLQLFRNTVNLQFRLSFPMVGFSYLINLDIAFSLWFFNLLSVAAKGTMRVLGISSTEVLGTYGAAHEPILAHQGTGAMVVLVLFGLWTGRRHLRQVLARAFRGDGDVDDSNEILSYRTAVFLWIGGVLVMSFWLRAAGMPLWGALVLVLFALLIFVGVTRIVAEGGVAECTGPVVAGPGLVSAIGTTALGPSGLVTLVFSYVWAGDIRTFVMASCAHGLKLGEHMGRRLRPLFWVILLAAALSLVASIAMILHLSYRYGGINLQAWFFGNGSMTPFNFAAHKLNNPAPPHLGGWLHTGLGAGIMALLMLARQHLLWWPLHPLGYPIAAIWAMNQIWFSIFVAWLIKLVVMKYGGPRLFRATRPFFLGLIAGQFAAAGVWLIVDYFTGMTDNMVFWM